jgi:hypothetical protein
VDKLIIRSGAGSLSEPIRLIRTGLRILALHRAVSEGQTEWGNNNSERTNRRQREVGRGRVRKQWPFKRSFFWVM